MLTKSLFSLAISCPTKLYYHANKAYNNQSSEDTFLQSLAEGGFQVGALARCYYPEGILVKKKETALALRRTNELLKQENVTIFEAAIVYKNLFIRVDILQKKGNLINLIEVKAKSYSKPDDEEFLNKKGKDIISSWKPYLYDIAFQQYVVEKAFPEKVIKPFLMLVDKDATATVNGLNQKFQLVDVGNSQKQVQILGECDKDALGEEIMVRIPVSMATGLIYETLYKKETDKATFSEWVSYLSEEYRNNNKIESAVGSKCKDCDFQCSPEEEQVGKKNGFKECFQKALKIPDAVFYEPNIFEIWDYRQKDKLIEQSIFLLRDMSDSDIGAKPAGQGCLSKKERQQLQIDKTKRNDRVTYFDYKGFKIEMKKWNYPYHFIDFETTAVAIPFHKGRRPYEGIAFQFSHHTMFEDGTIEHSGEYICAEKGKFPNFEFIRRLKEQLENDKGTIFRYANHENTYLNVIYNQLSASSEPDRESLCSWIKTITRSGRDSVEKWIGKRNMVDMLELVKCYYYHIDMKGSNSIKHVLPAVLNNSEFLQQKYCKPIYGDEIRSSNYNDWTWIKFDDNRNVINPYKLLDGVNNGGEALTAYGRMQFTFLDKEQHEDLGNQLLRYCELDTMAMVMIMEYFLQSCHNKPSKLIEKCLE